MTLPPVLRAVHVARTPEDAFALFTDRIGAWWPLLSHGVFGERSAGLAFSDGAIVERSQDGERAVWGEVIAWEPGRRLAFTWHPGRAETESTVVEVVFVPDENGTRVELTHSGWESLGERATRSRRSYAGPNAWGWVLEHFADTVERQGPGAGPVPDTAALRAAYRAFYDLALTGSFGDPSDGEWSPAQVVAHVAVNDDVLAGVCRAVLAGRAAALTNDVSNDTRRLDALVREHDGDLAALARTGLRRADELVLLIERLDDDQLQAPADCRIVDAGAVALDAPLPWGRVILELQAQQHLPGHLQQLAALRPSLE